MESTLGLSLNYYLAQTGNWLGWGYGAKSQTNQAVDDTPYVAYQSNELTQIVRSAVSGFYRAFDWSFLHPVATLELKPGSHSLRLPDDYGGMESKLVMLTTLNNTSWHPVEIRQGWQVRNGFALQPNLTGPPSMCAVEWEKGTTQLSGQRAQLIFFPLADQDYVLQVQYYVIPNMLDGDRPYVYGGALHSETILTGCLAIAEQRKNNAIGPQTQLYQQVLMNSKTLDSRNRPQQFGQITDSSDENRGRRNPHYYNFPLGTYNGASMD
jgi:hypothetical protein